MRSTQQSQTRLPGIAPREKCYRCFRPIASCYCATIPSIDNRTSIVIVQHMRERYHPFNTARMVHHALRNSSLVVDHVDKLGGLLPPFGPRAGLLFPSPDAQIISEVPRCDAPDQLVVLDGTWKHAKRILLSLPVLKALPKYRLVPSAPGQYRIRLEPTSDALSTVEATVEALRVLEPDTDGLDQLLGAFRTMVDTQLAHPQAYYPRNTER